MNPKQQHIVDVYGKPITSLDELGEACVAVVDEITPVVGFAWDIRFDHTVSCSHSAPVGQQTNFTGKEDRPRNFPGLSGRFWIRYADDAGHDYDWSGNMNSTLTWTGSGGSGSYDGLWTAISTASYRTRERVEDNTAAWNMRYVYKYPSPKCYSTDYKIFLQDWPDLDIGLEEAHQAHEDEEDKLQTFARVASKYRQRQKFIFTHKFAWEDPTQKAKDEAFLETYVADYLAKEAVEA